MNIQITLQPKQREALEKSECTPVTFMGGAKGGGKSYSIRARQLKRRLQYAGSRGLIVRKTYPELLSNHIRKFFEEYPIVQKWYNKSEKTIYYPNGSTTEFSYLKNTDDVYTYQGREYEDIDIDEITQHEEEVFKILRSSLRTSNKKLVDQGLRPSMYLTGNPGGIGHQWVKRIFIDKQFKPNENPEDFTFVPAFVQDNRALMIADPEYIKRLNDLPDHLRKAYLDGDWNIHAGQAFSELSIHKHIVKPFELPTTTRYFAGYDHGYNHPFAFVLFAVVSDGSVYVIRALSSRQKRPDEIYNMVVTATKGIKNLEIYAGVDLWSRQRDGSPSVFEQFHQLGLNHRNGYILTRAKTDRVQGVNEIRKWIAWNGKPNEVPRLFFFENCLDVYNTVAGMQFDSSNPEDVLKIDADSEGIGGDDYYDAFRYGVMSRLSAPKKEEDKYGVDTGMYLLQKHLARKKLEADSALWEFN